MTNDENEPRGISIFFSMEEAEEIINDMEGTFVGYGARRELISLLRKAVEDEKISAPRRQNNSAVNMAFELCNHCSNTKGSHGGGYDECPANEGRMDFMKEDLAHVFAPSGVIEPEEETNNWRQLAWTRSLCVPFSDEEIEGRLNNSVNILVRPKQSGETQCP